MNSLPPKPDWMSDSEFREHERRIARDETRLWWRDPEQPNGKAGNGPASGTRELAFPLIAWKDIDFDLEEEWRVDEVFPLVGLGCIYGGPSTVKTFILLHLLASVARGALWAGREVKQCPVVYIAAEGCAGIKKRIAGLKKVAAEKGLPPDIPFHLIAVAPNLGTGTGDLRKLIESLEALRNRAWSDCNRYGIAIAWWRRRKRPRHGSACEQRDRARQLFFLPRRACPSYAARR